jgi:hypothetical protein
MATVRTAPPASRNAPETVAWQLDLHRGWEAVDALHEDWERLYRAHPHPAAWCAWEAVAAVRSAGAGPWEPFVAVVRSDGAARALLPFSMRRRGRIQLVRLLGQALLPRHEPLVSAESAAIAPAPVLRALCTRLRGPCLFDLAGLWPDAPGTRWLVKGVENASGWAVAEGASDYEMTLSAGWPSVRASIGRSLRVAAARGEARAARAGGMAIEFRRAGPGDLEVLEGLLRRAPRTRAARVAAALAERATGGGRLLLAVATVGPEHAAAIAVWVDGDQAVELVAVADPAFAPFAVEPVLRVGLIRHLCEVRIRSLFLAPGVQPAAGALCAAPRRQVRLWGSPQPGLLRFYVRLAGWYSHEHRVGPALVRGLVRAFLR